ncbi:MAG: hypothetical protein ACXVY5_06055, partial [Gaiellales bacterium]
MQTAPHRFWHNRWFLPAFSVALGFMMLAAQWIGGHAREGVYSLGIMCGFAAIVLLGGRSETIPGLRGDGRDERFEMIDLRASAFAGLVVITAIIGMFMYELSQGRDGN